jgi:hypothetical protein
LARIEWVIEELQAIVDDLAAELGSGVAIDNRQLKLVVHSVHQGHIDPVRRQSILLRQPSAEAMEWVRSHNIANATGAIRIAGSPALKAVERVCVPIRCENLLLGFLWLTDRDGTITDQDLPRCERAAEAAARLLFRQRMLQQGVRSHGRALLRDLLFGDPGARQESATLLLEEGLVLDGPIVVLVADAGRNGSAANEELWLEQMFDMAHRALPPHSMIDMALPDHGVILLAVGALESGDGGAERAAKQFHAALLQAAARTSRPESSVLVAYGRAFESLQHARVSYEQARSAARVAGSVPSFDGIVGWDELGVYQTLAQLPPDAIEDPGSRVRPLCEVPELLRTIEVYLDRAGDVKATASELSLHRASLYYRLQKIEELLGVDLKNGEDRLMLHLGIKLLRLAGLHPDQEPTEQPQ